MNKRLFAALGILSLGTVAAHLAAAAPPAANARLAAVAARQAQMKRLGGATKTIYGFNQGAHSDVARLREAAATIQQVAGGMHRLFPAGTGVGVGTSKARPNIWTDQAAFQRRIVNLRAASAELVAAAATGDKAQVRPKFQAVGAACKGCHDFFQVPH